MFCRGCRVFKRWNRDILSDSLFISWNVQMLPVAAQRWAKKFLLHYIVVLKGVSECFLCYQNLSWSKVKVTLPKIGQNYTLQHIFRMACQNFKIFMAKWSARMCSNKTQPFPSSKRGDFAKSLFSPQFLRGVTYFRWLAPILVLIF